MKNKAIQSFCKGNNIELLVLFGSCASGETHSACDIDLAVKFKRGEEISKQMTTYLNDLMPYKDISFEKFMEKHYEIERLIELLVITASDIIFHLISAEGKQRPTSYKAAFLRAGEIGIISED